MKQLLIPFIVLIVSANSLYSQNKIIKGKVISDDFENVPLASIIINDTIEVGKTELNGFFQINIPISQKKILFKFIGLETTPIELTDTCDKLEVVMLSRATYDFVTPKRVDRLRMKRFKKLPELHKEAFEKGLFKTQKACYTQEFIHSYNKKQESTTRAREK